MMGTQMGKRALHPLTSRLETAHRLRQEFQCINICCKGCRERRERKTISLHVSSLFQNSNELGSELSLTLGLGVIPFSIHFLGNSNKTLSGCASLPASPGSRSLQSHDPCEPTGGTQGPHLSPSVIHYR